MEGTVTVPDDELDALARSLGWIDTNKTPQDQYVLDAAQGFLNNEIIAVAATTVIETARKQAISDKQTKLANIAPSVTVKSVGVVVSEPPIQKLN